MQKNLLWYNFLLVNQSHYKTIKLFTENNWIKALVANYKTIKQFTVNSKGKAVPYQTCHVQYQ